MSIYKNEITKEMLEKAMQCKTAEDLIAFAKTEGVDLTKEEAEAYFDELSESVIKVSLLNPAIEDSMASCTLHSNLFNSCRTVVSAAVVLVRKISVLRRKS